MRAPPDVCLANPFAWPQVRRGTETLMRSLARWLHSTGSAVEIVAGGTRSASYELDGVPVTLVRARTARRLHRDLDEETTFIPGMARYFRRRRPRLVHAFLYSDASAARLARVPYVVSYGGIALRSSFDAHPLKWRLFRFASDGAAAIVCPSVAAAAHLREEYGYEARVIPNGLDTAAFATQARRVPGLILCPATPDDDRKRIDVLVDAFVLAATSAADEMRLILAGAASPARRRALEERVPPELRPAIEFTGDVDDVELRRLYSMASLTCLPSLHEAFGMVVVESLASGTPVVVADHGALPELVDSNVGALFTPEDVNACARALATVLGEGDDAARAERCRARAREYDWAVIGPRWQSLYEEVVP